MKTSKSFLMLLVLVLTLVTAFVPFNVIWADTATHVAHNVAPGDSAEDNPLKGFMPFAPDNGNFPCSMEWGYLPVNAIQKDYNTFDWTALETQLNEIAGRGHQTVFRFYLDYPNKASGIPQFLIKAGLKLKDYNNQSVGAGQCPDYEDQNLRKAMQNFIIAFGAKYDGDPRIAFITAGLLGFWGEWHCWPYDGSNGNPNWAPSVDVMNEVLTAYDKAFKVTPILVRYPKANAPLMKFGYHDDHSLLKPCRHLWVENHGILYNS